MDESAENIFIHYMCQSLGLKCDGLDIFSWEVMDFVIDFFGVKMIEVWALPEKSGQQYFILYFILNLEVRK